MIICSITSAKLIMAVLTLWLVYHAVEVYLTPAFPSWPKFEPPIKHAKLLLSEFYRDFLQTARARFATPTAAHSSFILLPLFNSARPLSNAFQMRIFGQGSQ